MPEGVSVEFTGPFREITGARGVTVNIGRVTSLGSLISTLSKMYGEEFRRRIVDDEGAGLRADSSMVAINQVVVDPVGALSRSVRSGDRVVFALSIAGGG